MTEKNRRVQFHEMGLDDRILKAIGKLGWKSPTLIQERAIPLVLEGKDVLARARTGSGKTAAFLVPIVHKVLQNKQMSTLQQVKVLVLAPSKELCKQIFSNFKAITSCCSRDINAVDVSGSVKTDLKSPLLNEYPDVIIGTPSSVLALLQPRSVDIRESLETLVIDEADLTFSFGFEEDMFKLLKFLPRIYQAILMSATLGDDVIALKKLVLHNPVTLKLEESNLPDTSQLTQYHINCEEDEKFVLVYAFLKLKLIRGRTLIFVNKVNQCYRLKIFLEQFGIHACALNEELPANCRNDVIEQFNNGISDIIIASDSKIVKDEPQTSKAHSSNTPKPNRKRFKKDKEYGTSRGIDFQFITNVINFDFPPDLNTYIHRVGRTARGTVQGNALSFISSKEHDLMLSLEKQLSETSGGTVHVFKPYQFKMEEMEGFRYRAMDALRAATRIAVKEARLKEIKKALLTSRKLKSYFEDNPRDKQVLRHDGFLHAIRNQPHLRDVPEYIVPETLKNLASFKNTMKVKGKKTFNRGRISHKQRLRTKKKKRRNQDPLRSFKSGRLPNK